ncbi:hypothetical protein [Mesorhizobium sp. STM 4661]|uniref:hypothetical protein n=1 Tax=Mesorhizobium sp. STM 4661 TaxID=1297570 RepID=UPI0002BD9B02|nr:hypothetical protein [Mesorhizobium sp. STM 4661]CCV10291.1 exported hypothetical protein [Mesorhizobium sp. STM 4661]
MTSVASARRDRLAPVLMRIVALIAALAFFGLLPFPQPANAQDILLAMINIMDEAGAQFAFPAQLEYSAADLPIDDEKRVAAENRVNAWRDEENLPFPDFSQIDKLALNNTHAYPPRGSAQYRETEPDPTSAEARATLEKVRWSLPWKKGA